MRLFFKFYCARSYLCSIQLLLLLFVEEPDGKLMVLVVADTNTLMIYEGTTLKWSSQLNVKPIAIARTSLLVIVYILLYFVKRMKNLYFRDSAQHSQRYAVLTLVYWKIPTSGLLFCSWNNKPLEDLTNREEGIPVCVFVCVWLREKLVGCNNYNHHQQKHFFCFQFFFLHFFFCYWLVVTLIIILGKNCNECARFVLFARI